MEMKGERKREVWELGERDREKTRDIGRDIDKEDYPLKAVLLEGYLSLFVSL